MRDLRYLTFGLAVAAGLTLAPSLVKADAMASPKLLASNCFNCHGYMGYSNGILDELVTRGMMRKLREFKSGEKPSTIMGRIARGYNDSELKAITAFFKEAEEAEAAGSKK